MADAPNQAGETAARQPQAMANRMYPVPPYYYKAFTDQAWKAHKLARQAGPANPDRGDISPAGAPSATTLVDESVWNPFTSSDRDDLSSKTRILFKPPRADWMIENDYFESFGQPHQVRLLQLRLLRSRFSNVYLDHDPAARQACERTRAKSTLNPTDRR